MNDYRVRLYRTCLYQVPAAVGVWCRAEDLDGVDGQIRRSLTAYQGEDVRCITDPVALDQYLADYVTWLCPLAVLAAAANIAAWQNGPRTGGIIGSLGGEAHVIDEHMAEILPQVWCLSYAGGPGLLLQGSRQAAWKMREYLEYPGQQFTWNDVRLHLKQQSVSAYLYVTDGSGGEGILACGDEQKEERICLSDNNISF